MNARIVADETVAAAQCFVGPLGDLVVLPPDRITPDALRRADALVVRSAVRVGRTLLEGTAVRFVGTATSGANHVDTAYLEDAGIAFAAAPGCNAAAVAEYIIAALLGWGRRSGRAPAGRTLGVIGAGHVGRRVAALAPLLGLDVLVCDPPRARTEGPAGFVPFDRIVGRSDILTLHVPLIEGGPDRTRGMMDADVIDALPAGALLINTARGGVVDTGAAVRARRGGRLSGLLVDVWSGEPAVDRDVLAAADLMTPHTAGYSVEGRLRGTHAIALALARFLGGKTDDPPSDHGLAPVARTIEAPVARTIEAPAGRTIGNAPALRPVSPSGHNDLAAWVLAAFDPWVDSDAFARQVRAASGDGAEEFRRFRRTYRERREFSAFRLPDGPKAMTGDLRDGLRRMGFDAA